MAAIAKKQFLVTRAMAAIAPTWALKRAQARLQLDGINNISSRRYEAASRAPRMKGMFSRSVGPKSATAELSLLRNRCRDLDRNNAWYRRAIDILTNNVVGVGIRAQLATPEKSNTRRDKLQKRWNEWAESFDCDYDGQNDLYGLQRLIYRTVRISGECLMRRHVGPSGLKLQIIEPDFLDESRDTNLPDGSYIYQGIEFNADNQRVAYWLFPWHPDEAIGGKISQISKRIPIAEVIHVFRADRPGQVRGVPAGLQILVRLHDLDEFQDAELMKNKISALFAAFRTSPHSGPSTPSTTKTAAAPNLYPGTVETLAPGEDIRFAQPPQHQMYPEYVRTILMEIAAAFGLTYEMLSGDLSRTNFSSGRMGQLESGRYFKADQKDLVINGFMKQVTKWWTEIESLRGPIRTTDLTWKWFPPHRELIDPAKEIKAMVDGLAAKVTSHKQIWAQFGYEPDEMIDDIAEVENKMREKGIEVPTQIKATPKNVKAKSKTEDEDDNA